MSATKFQVQYRSKSKKRQTNWQDWFEPFIDLRSAIEEMEALEQEEPFRYEWRVLEVRPEDKQVYVPTAQEREEMMEYGFWM